jgi:prepilin-type N-terminal cleavage/methylation domain-containing protein
MIKHKLKQQISPCDESGFTIIESLVAILVVSILLTAIAPVIVLATATRVQSRRVELATQAAKTFIDGVRTGAIAAPSEVITLLPPTDAAPRRVSDVPATGTTPAVTGKPGDYLIDNMTTQEMPAPIDSTKNKLYCSNENGIISDPDCTSNTDNLFYIQAKRIIQSTGANDGYRLGIRVYRADADFPLTASTADTKNTQTPFTGGLGSRKAPLIEMTTDVANSNTSFRALCQRLGIATNKNCQ